MSELFKVARDWEGETCAVLGGGPSMSPAIAASLRGRCRVVAVNNNGVPTVDAGGVNHEAAAPWADVLYAADRLWWHNNRAAAENFAGLKATMMPNGFTDFVPVVDGVRILGNGGPRGFDERTDYLRTGWNSGYQALHLAAHFGVARVLLIGFDMHGNGGEHWHGDHSWRPGYRSRYELFLSAFDELAAELGRRGVDVVNCTPGSALKCFRTAGTEEGLTDGVQHVRKGAPHFAGTRAPGSRGARASTGGSQAAAKEEVDGASRIV